MSIKICKYFVFLIASIDLVACGTKLNKSKKENNEHRVSGGRDIDISQRPFQALITRFNHPENETYGTSNCGGTIYNRRYIITAAHCIYPIGENGVRVDAANSQFIVFLGRVQHPDLFENDLIEGEQKYSVIEQIAHEKYDKNMTLNSKHTALSYDIAVLKLDRDIIYSKTVKPLRIQTCPPTPNSVATISGWGQANDRVYLGSESDDDELIFKENLQIAELKILSQDECMDKMIKKDYLSLYKPNTTEKLDWNHRFGTRCLHRDYICAYAPDKDACMGDSGGPLVCGPKECPRLCGIVSYGEGCALDFPGFYVDVHKLKCWIRQHAGLQDI